MTEFYTHYVSIRREEATAIHWQFTAASHVNWQQQEQRKIYSKLQQLLEIGFRILSAYDMVGHEDRINMIGSAIVDGGQKWIETHPKQIEWLESIGVTTDEAVESFEEWKEYVRSQFHNHAE